MSTFDEKILNNYMALLEGLASPIKLKIIEQLKESLDKKPLKKSKVISSFGMWKSNESAEEIIKDIRESRKTNRIIEEL